MSEYLNEQEWQTAQPEGWSADIFPEVAAARAAARFEAEAIQQNVEVEATLPIVDPIGNARRAVLAEPDSVAEQAALEGLFADSHTALQEAMRRLTYELFTDREFRYDPQAGDLMAYGEPLGEVLRKGLSHQAGPERVAEYVEHATAVALIEHGMHDEYDLLTISPCRQGAEQGSGDVPEIDKLMLRLSRFEQDGVGRVVMRTQYLGMRGIDLPPAVITRWLFEVGAADTGETLSRLDILERQVVLRRGSLPSILHAAEGLDRAGDQTLMLGERFQPWDRRDYARVPREASRRHRELMEAARVLADFALIDAQDGVSPLSAAIRIQLKVDELVQAICHRDPQQARWAFDVETAERYREAAWLEAQGLFDVAAMVWQEADAVRPMAAFCGAGGCELERMSTEQATFAAKAGLDRDALFYKGGQCGNCNAKGVLADKQGRRACAKCGSAKEKGQEARKVDSQAEGKG